MKKTMLLALLLSGSLCLLSPAAVAGTNEDLISAAMRGDSSQVEDLLDQGAELNFRDDMGYSALMWAASEGHIEVARLLLSKGADVSIKSDAAKVTAREIAESSNHLDIVELLDLNAETTSVEAEAPPKPSATSPAHAAALTSTKKAHVKPSPKLQPAVKLQRLPAFRVIMDQVQLAEELAWLDASDGSTNFKEDWASSIPKQVELFLLNKPKKDSLTHFGMVQKYKSQIKTAFNELGLIGGSIATFYYFKDELPIAFTTKGNKKVVLIHGLRSENVYNTLTTTSKSRAQKVIESMYIPALPDIYKAFAKTDVGYIGISIVYGSKDFSDDESVMNRQAEIVTVIADKGLCRKFVNDEITQEEFLERAEVYLKDRDIVGSSKRVKIGL